MRYRKEINGDYGFGRGDNNFWINNAEAVAQAVYSRLKLWRGEWFLNTEEGTAWASVVLGEQPQALQTLMVRDRIAGTPGVRRITNLSSRQDPESRRLVVSATLDTVYGEVTINV
ncbi:hypothetical protein TUM12370_09410 [Salmonella enterica subsp. enterica serovar Choleraesuis]|nr:hypothetical protein TUM12370_09410 [Salmonella enterica subsp. enterica serovar Choleraesuis]